MYANAGNTCYRIIAEGSEEVPTLKTQQEKADGHLLLHPSHAANEIVNSVLVCLEETDVFFMSLAFWHELRYQLFCSRRGKMEIYQLPPWRDCLVKHAKRANYQVAIWKRCLEQDPQVWTPIGWGWKIEHEDGVAKLVVEWMDIKAAPETILELLACNCAKKCVAPKCVCAANGLRCTDMCRLACENQEIESADEDYGVDSDEEY